MQQSEIHTRECCCSMRVKTLIDWLSWWLMHFWHSFNLLACRGNCCVDLYIESTTWQPACYLFNTQNGSRSKCTLHRDSRQALHFIALISRSKVVRELRHSTAVFIRMRKTRRRSSRWMNGWSVYKLNCSPRSTGIELLIKWEAALIGD